MLSLSRNDDVYLAMTLRRPSKVKTIPRQYGRLFKTNQVWCSTGEVWGTKVWGTKETSNAIWCCSQLGTTTLVASHTEKSTWKWSHMLSGCLHCPEYNGYYTRLFSEAGMIPVAKVEVAYLLLIACLLTLIQSNLPWEGPFWWWRPNIHLWSINSCIWWHSLLWTSFMCSTYLGGGAYVDGFYTYDGLKWIERMLSGKKYLQKFCALVEELLFMLLLREM